MAISRKGFSIIEVLIAVMITSIAGIALLQAAAQGRRIYDVAKQHQQHLELSSLVALSSSLMGGNGESNLQTLIASRYHAENLPMIDSLKTHNFILKTQNLYPLEQDTQSSEAKQTLSSSAKIFIEQTSIEMDGKRTALYGLSGDGWE